MSSTRPQRPSLRSALARRLGTLGCAIVASLSAWGVAAAQETPDTAAAEPVTVEALTIVAPSPAPAATPAPVATAAEAPLRHVRLEARLVATTPERLRELGVRFETAVRPEVEGGAAETAQETATRVRPDLGPRLDRALHKLANRGELRLLAQPTLFAASGCETNFSGGGEAPYIAEDSTLKFKPYGAHLSLRPKVDTDGVVRLAVDIAVDAPPDRSDLSNVDAGPRRLQTVADLKSGETLILAGLFPDAAKAPHRAHNPISRVFGARKQAPQGTQLALILTSHVEGEPTPEPLPESEMTVARFAADTSYRPFWARGPPLRALASVVQRLQAVLAPAYRDSRGGAWSKAVASSSRIVRL